MGTYTANLYINTHICKYYWLTFGAIAIKYIEQTKNSKISATYSAKQKAA